MAGQFGRILSVLFVALFLAPLVVGCVQEDGVGGKLKSLEDFLAGKLSKDYDPPDYAGPPLGQLPDYQAGDAYTYSNGRTETIDEIGEETVAWRNDLDSRFDRYPNFVLPTARTRTDRGEVSREFSVPPDVLWPLIPGTRRQFTSAVRVRQQGQNGERLFRRDWVCTVHGAEPVTVQFGAFDSVKISCDRYSRGKWRQTRTWYYVPAIGHYVRQTDRYAGHDEREVELISIQQAFNGLSQDAKRALYDLEQQTLERMPSGKPASWRSTNGDVAVTMTVTKTMQTEAGQFCRTFRQEVNGNGVERLVPGLACRTWNGRWVRL